MPDQVDDAKVRAMMGAEVMTWDIDRVVHAASEVQGPIVVSREGETVAVYPFYCEPRIDDGTPPSTRDHAGDLHLWDPRQRRYVGEHKRGTWDEVQHRPQYAGIIIDKRGGTRVR